MPDVSSTAPSLTSLSVGTMRTIPLRGSHASRQAASRLPLPATLTAPNAAREFSPLETHRLTDLQSADVTRTSIGLGWSNAFMSVQTQNPFTARFPGTSSILISVVNFGCARATVSLRGNGTAKIKEMEAAPGSICILPDMQAFDCELKNRVGCTYLYLSRRLLDQIASDLCNLSPSRVDLIPRLAIFDPVLEQLINAVRDALDDQPDLSRLYVDYLLGAIAARLIKNHSNFAEGSKPYTTQERLGTRLVERTREMIEARLAGRLSTADLAKGTGLGADQFGRVFKQASGVSLYQFVIRCRVDRACRLLAETRMPIVQIALDCGFADQVHLTRAFARIVGTTPAAYRKDKRS